MISSVRECVEEKIDGFMNYQFKVLRGTSNEEYQFSFVDLPFMNPND